MEYEAVTRSRETTTSLWDHVPTSFLSLSSRPHLERFVRIFEISKFLYMHRDILLFSPDISYSLDWHLRHVYSSKHYTRGSERHPSIRDQPRTTRPSPPITFLSCHIPHITPTSQQYSDTIPLANTVLKAQLSVPWMRMLSQLLRSVSSQIIRSILWM